MLTTKIDYAIMASMPEELAYVLEVFKDLKFSEIKIGEFVFKIYNYQDNNILIAYSGIGTSFASSMMTLIYTSLQPEYFLVSGTAGAIKSDLKLRDVVIAEKAFEAEIQNTWALLKNTPFETALIHPSKHEYFPSCYHADIDMVKLCESLNFKNMRLHKGTVVTSDTFPAPKELYEKIKSSGAYSIDMETSAFYQTAWLLNAKVLAVRGISNILNPEGGDENLHESDLQGGSEAAATVLLEVMNKLIALRKSEKFTQKKVKL